MAHSPKYPKGRQNPNEPSIEKKSRRSKARSESRVIMSVSIFFFCVCVSEELADSLVNNAAPLDVVEVHGT